MINTRTILFAIGLVAAAAVGVYLYVVGGQSVSTDNAYLRFDKVTLSAEVSGAVINVPVAENQKVQRGELLVTLDDAPYRVAVAKAEARLRKSQSYIESLKARYQTKQAELSLAIDNLEFERRAYQREQNLGQQKLTSEAQLDERQHNVDTATRRIAIIRQEIAQLRASLSDNVDGPLAEYSEVMEAQADLNLARINLRHCRVVAPFDGVVSHLPKLGQHMAPGSSILSLVSSADAWIEANFKETDLVNVREGQSVEVTIDAYPGLNWEGVVESLSPATGAEYSLLPPQNATGNWIKVVQRVPIRIRLLPRKKSPVLRAGMSAFVNIDTRQSSK